MKRAPWLLAAVCLVDSSVFAQSAPEGTELRLDTDQPTVAASLRPNPDGGKPDGYAMYIVQLRDDAVATYRGGIPSLAATNPAVTGARRLDVNSPASRAYADYLRARQAEFMANCDEALNRRARQAFSYQHAFNGLAIEISAAEAQIVEGLPGVAKVTKETVEIPTTDVGPQWIGASRIWGGAGAHPPSMGEGTVIAVLDTGINHDNPSFADIGADGFDHTNPLGSGKYIPGSYCDTTDPAFCNDKLIGAWSFVGGPTDPTSPEDSVNHGSHTAGTAGGNFVDSATVLAPTTSMTRNISGVAPHANIIAYDVCVGGCPGSALLAAVNQVVIDAAALPDGIHALNYSISGGNDPYNDAVELAFLNATAAGVYVATSAGNAGPGPATTGHNSPWVAATAALTHPRAINNTLGGLSSDGLALADLAGSGLTSGFGPAPVVHARDFPTNNGSQNDTDPGQCLAPFPAGHFNGEIVVCDRGAIARVAKGANVLAGGAGGYVLANLAGNGESVNADAHFLPAVHLGFTAAESLRNWLAAETNTVASISGFVLDEGPQNADFMAGFSSRGPNSAIDILKPDLGAPGVNVMAPINSAAGSSGREFGLISGTSMASPHNAGAAALVHALTDWTPYEIKSAFMMTAHRQATKEDNITAADPFDIGAGRINLRRALDAGLVLDETPANFLAADPSAGGDPKTLNIASMQDGRCVHECSWTRTVKNVTNRRGRWDVRARGPDGVDLSVTPKRLRLRKGKTGQFTVSAGAAVASSGWNFAEVTLTPRHRGPTLHMPIAIQPAVTTLPNVLGMSADRSTAVTGDTMSYAIEVTNGPLGGPIALDSVLGKNLQIVRDSLTAEITNGITDQKFSYNRRKDRVEWQGTLKPGGVELETSAAPFGYFSLASLGVAPFGCPSNCDDGGVTLTVPTFRYNGQTYTSVIWSVNGTLEPGANGTPTSASNQNLPSPTAPNNLIAPFWTDLDLGTNGDGAEWYVANLTAGASTFTVYEWTNVPQFGDPTNRYTFQVWVQRAPTDNIWFVYAELGDVSGATVGLENHDGTAGMSYFFEGAGTAPAVGTDLRIKELAGGRATFRYQAVTKGCGRGDDDDDDDGDDDDDDDDGGQRADGRTTTIVATANLRNGGDHERAIAVTRCARRMKR